jgi:hypothetical protein
VRRGGASSRRHAAVSKPPDHQCDQDASNIEHQAPPHRHPSSVPCAPVVDVLYP